SKVSPQGDLLHLQIPGAFPSGDVAAEGAPFGALGFDRALEDVVAERARSGTIDASRPGVQDGTHVIPFEGVRDCHSGAAYFGETVSLAAMPSPFALPWRAQK